MTTTAARLERDNAFGFLSRHTESEQVFHPVLISNADGNTMVKAITAELRRAASFTFSVAFIETSAISLLKQSLIDFGGRGRLITSTYLGFNSPAAFRELLNMPNTDVFVVQPKHGGFHAKGYLFTHSDSTTAIIGSSNLTSSALIRNQEWNLRFSALPDGDIVSQLTKAVEEQLCVAEPLTSAWINEYEKTWTAPPRNPIAPAQQPALDGHVTPNTMQAEALEAIRKVRESGEKRAVVVSATGTGKTILAALDVREFAPKRMLFLVHREQILDRAIEEFQRVLNAPASEFGKFVGRTRQLDRRYVFATVQSLARSENLGSIPRDHFDYVLVDEVHRIGASSYQKVIEHLGPDFLLGVTATPERTDDFNVFEMFDYNVPYEIRLQRALEADMLAPFHYFGVTDFEVDGRVIDDSAQLSRLVAPERVDHICAAIQTYGHAGSTVRGLMFCSRKEEAYELSQLLNERQINGRPLRTQVLTGDDSIDAREAAVERLELGRIDYILTVDVFNEGIDIPSVNQVVMLRQTQSSIIFTQQLGRGLRKAAGKDHLIVIDFIGNYTNNYLIPIALFGNTSLNKDSIRRSIIESQESGSISGLSSVNFDQVSKERIFASLASTKLDSMQALKRSITELAHRLGRPPRLIDFARFDTADPVVIANTKDNYWQLLAAVKQEDRAADEDQNAALKFLSRELLSGKRPHELVVLTRLLESTAGLDDGEFATLLRSHGCTTDEATLRSVERILTQEFFTAPQRGQYGAPLVERHGDRIALTAHARGLLSDTLFESHARDVIETGLFLARHRNRWASGLEVGMRYSRKDVCRLLNWEKNEEGTINGYKVDRYSATCPIFVTYHKHGEVSASTAYGDEFLNESSMHWFTRSRRTLASAEVRSIVENQVPLHLFAKKDDAEGRDFYYLGRARSSDPKQTKMRGDDGSMLDVVTMTLGIESPIDASLYDYFVTKAAGNVLEYDGVVRD